MNTSLGDFIQIAKASSGYQTPQIAADATLVEEVLRIEKEGIKETELSEAVKEHADHIVELMQAKNLVANERDQLKKELEEVKSFLEALSKEIHTMGSDNVKLNAQLSALTKAGDEFDRWLGRAHIRYNAGECQRCKAHAEWQRVKKESGL